MSCDAASHATLSVNMLTVAMDLADGCENEEKTNPTATPVNTSRAASGNVRIWASHCESDVPLKTGSPPCRDRLGASAASATVDWGWPGPSSGPGPKNGSHDPLNAA